MIKVATENAIRYIENNHDTRGSGAKIRVKECPFCESRSYDVSFNIETQVLTSFCCDKNTTLIDLVKHDQGLSSIKQAIEHLSQFGSTKVVWVSQTNLVSQEDRSVKIQAIRDRIKRVYRIDAALRSEPLDLTFYSTDFSTLIGKQVHAYAEKRKVPEWFIESGRLGYFTRGSLRKRLSFLTVEEDQAVFAVGRAIDDETEPKYLATNSEDIGSDFGSSDFVFNLDLVEQKDFIVVHEGVLSALSGMAAAASESHVATFGKGISSVQIHKIAEREPSGVLFLIEPGVNRALVEESAFKMQAKGIFTMTAPLLRGDMNDDETQFSEVVAGAQQSTRFSRLKARVLYRKSV